MIICIGAGPGDIAYLTQRGAELIKLCQAALERVREQVRVLDGEVFRPLDAAPPESQRGDVS